MTGNDFIRKVKTLGKAQRITVSLNAARGKGSHQTLYLGAAFTVVRNPKDELKTERSGVSVKANACESRRNAETKTGTFHAMCKQLGIKPSDL